MKQLPVKKIDNSDNSFTIIDDNKWDHKKALEKALKEKDILLKSSKKLRDYQKKIDEKLKFAETFEDRMQVLGKMMGQNLNRLHNECMKLQNLCEKNGVKMKTPLVNFNQQDIKRLTCSEVEVDLGAKTNFSVLPKSNKNGTQL